MSIQAEFAQPIAGSYLKPHIAIECFVGDLFLLPKKQMITTLIQRTLGEQCGHGSMVVNCIALDETLAEKWVALTRRVANSQIKERASDKQLVRHLYDIYHLLNSGLLENKYLHIVKNVIEKDRQHFKLHNESYYRDPVNVSLNSVELLNSQCWREHWDRFMLEMVYETPRPNFEDAYASLREMTHNLLENITVN